MLLGRTCRRRLVLPLPIESGCGQCRVARLQLMQHLRGGRPSGRVVQRYVYGKNQPRVCNEGWATPFCISWGWPSEDRLEKCVYAGLQPLDCLRRGRFCVVLTASFDALAEEAVAPGVGNVIQRGPAPAAEQAMILHIFHPV